MFSLCGLSEINANRVVGFVKEDEYAGTNVWLIFTMPVVRLTMHESIELSLKFRL